MKSILKKIIYMLFKIIKYIFIFIFSIIILYIIATFLDREFAKGVTKEKILSLEMGMTKKEVIKILGKPLESSSYVYEDKNIDIFLYAKSRFMISGVEVNLKISDNILSGIGLELDDIYFYKCYEGYSNSCPKIISPFLWKYLIPND